MSEPLTASRLLDRMMKNVGIPWQSQRADGFGDGIHLGPPDTVVTRLFDNWDARKTDAQLRGLAVALRWDKYHLARKRGVDLYRPGNEYFSLPKTSLGQLVKDIQTTLRVHGVRVIGDAQSQVSKAALTHGFLLVADLQRVMKEPGVD